MATDSVNGGIKIDYLSRFREQYKLWDDNQVNDSETEKKLKEEEKKESLTRKKEGEKKYDHLCPAMKKKMEEKTEEEKAEVREVTDSSNPPGQTLHGFENEIKSLKLFLMDKKVYKEFKSLMIVGEYGVGKTALCKHIFNDEDVKSVYAPRIWVSMASEEKLEGEEAKGKEKPEGEAKEKVKSEEEIKKISLTKKICVVKKILKDLVAEELLKTIHGEAKDEAKVNLEGGNNQRDGEIDRETAEEKELSALLYALHLSLRWKKYLIVFDDVREEDEWNQNLGKEPNEDEKWGKFLSDGFPKGSGGRVIYTTRDEDKTLQDKLVAKKHEIHRLWPLTDTTWVWKIYEEALAKNGEKNPPRNDKKCIDELMNKSRGLPLAAIKLATLLPVYVDDNKDKEDETKKNATNGTADNSTQQQTQTCC